MQYSTFEGSIAKHNGNILNGQYRAMTRDSSLANAGQNILKYTNKKGAYPIEDFYDDMEDQS